MLVPVATEAPRAVAPVAKLVVEGKAAAAQAVEVMAERKEAQVEPVVRPWATPEAGPEVAATAEVGMVVAAPAEVVRAAEAKVVVG